MTDSTTPTPSGWYPDPSGQPQWRVWTGSQWSTMTRPYGTSRPSTPEILASLNQFRSLARARYFAPLGYFTGLNLLVSIIGNWPSGPHPLAHLWLLPLLGACAFFLIMAWVICAQAVRSFQESWTFWALLPVGNLFVLSGLLRKRLLGPLARSSSGDLVGIGMWIIVATSTPLAGIITALIAFGQVLLIGAYLNTATLS